LSAANLYADGVWATTGDDLLALPNVGSLAGAITVLLAMAMGEFVDFAN
jgi:hypothetical protein